ncbi:hypothetical protein NQ176_g3062 [Zarea fungicola]|uniref:Uncharacterized protein n=1 Tax=Zarea fungicola TaxID=93591 RepID=A0ACC1NMV2_9HYPO|nr:hypothetical protein NQ176_g3062 [Lecanicillium fungicola]
MDHILLPDGSPVPPVRNSGDFLATIKGSRSGWDKYEFDIVKWVGEDSNVAVRWKMRGVIGQNFGRPT